MPPRQRSHSVALGMSEDYHWSKVYDLLRDRKFRADGPHTLAKLVSDHLGVPRSQMANLEKLINRKIDSGHIKRRSPAIGRLSEYWVP